jgi:hypothetical protein
MSTNTSNKATRRGDPM